MKIWSRTLLLRSLFRWFQKNNEMFNCHAFGGKNLNIIWKKNILEKIPNFTAFGSDKSPWSQTKKGDYLQFLEKTIIRLRSDFYDETKISMIFYTFFGRLWSIRNQWNCSGTNMFAKLLHSITTASVAAVNEATSRFRHPERNELKPSIRKANNTIFKANLQPCQRAPKESKYC